MTKLQILTWLCKDRHLIIRDSINLAEKRFLRYNGIKLILGCTMGFITLLIICLILSRTILAQWFNPIYLEQINSRQIQKLSAHVDTLEKQTKQQEKFIALLQGMIRGEDPQEIYPTRLATPLSISESNLTDKNINTVPEVQPEQPFHIGHFKTIFFTPINGIVTTHFCTKDKHYGIDIVSKEHDPIKCIANGVVTIASWTVDTGWLVAIQHSGGLVSVYKHNASVLRKSGDFVQAGDVVAMMGNSGALSSGPHLHFEMWYEGTPINPEHYISF